MKANLDEKTSPPTVGKELEVLAAERNDAENRLDEIRRKTWRKVREARDEGLTVKEIAKHLGVSPSALYGKAARTDPHGSATKRLRPRRREDR